MQPEKRTVILISVGVVMAILIIIAAVLLMKGRGGDGKYEEYYSQAMEYYIDGDFENAAASAKKGSTPTRPLFPRNMHGNLKN